MKLLGCFCIRRKKEKKEKDDPEVIKEKEKKVPKINKKKEKDVPKVNKEKEKKVAKVIKKNQIEIPISIEESEKENEVPEVFKEKENKIPINIEELEKEDQVLEVIKEKENKIPINIEELEKENEDEVLEVIKEKENEIPIISEVNEPPPLNYEDENCYMNSMMQALGSCEKLRTDLKILALEYNCEKLTLFINLLDGLNSIKAQDEFNKFMNQYGWKKRGQQDSYEMMTFLINSIYNELKEQEMNKFESINKRKFNSMWKEKALPCRLNMYSKATCGCESKKKNITNDLSLHLPLVNEEGIIYKFENMMKAVFFEDIVEDGCEDCLKGKTLRLDIDGDPPRTLCLHIQANKYNEETGDVIKPKYQMDFPFNFELKSKNYEIVSFLEHMGGAFSGHYISYRKFNKTWFLVDDQHVERIPDPKDSSDLCLKPYVLFYEECD